MRRKINEFGSLIKALKTNNIKDLKNILEYGFDIKKKYEKYNNMNVLHLCCKFNNFAALELLVKGYVANIHARADEGAQVIHTTIVFYHQGTDLNCIRLLLRAGADPNSVITRKMYSKLSGSDAAPWPVEYADSLSLLAYAIARHHTNLIQLLVKFKADLTERISNNKTLLMLAMEQENYKTTQVVIKCFRFNCPKLLHARDEKGNHAFDYLLSDIHYKGYRISGHQLINNFEMLQIVRQFYFTDIYYFNWLDRNLYTKLMETAAYRRIPNIIHFLGIIITPFHGSKALENAMIPVEDPNKLWRPLDDESGNVAMVRGYYLQDSEESTIYHIIRDIKIRQELGIPVTNQEVSGINKFVTTTDKPEMVRVINMAQRIVIDRHLKGNFIEMGNSRISLYDLGLKVFNPKILRQITRNRDIFNALEDALSKNVTRKGVWDFETTFIHKLHNEVLMSTMRNELLEKSKRIKMLKKFIPLPYELILDIYEFLSNIDLSNFIEAFNI